jgi:hypothetical protein
MRKSSPKRADCGYFDGPSVVTLRAMGCR